jgi:hypothetical protein
MMIRESAIHLNHLIAFNHIKKEEPNEQNKISIFIDRDSVADFFIDRQYNG